MQSARTEELFRAGESTGPALPLKEKRIAVDGLQISYRSAGEGTPLLILHGWGGSFLSWEKVQRRLAASGYYVICPDLPGFGKSADPPTPWDVGDYSGFLADFVGKIGLDGFSLLGHSLGGGLATRFVAEHPGRVKALVLCDAAVVTNRNNLDLRQKIAFALTEGGYDFFSVPIFTRTLYRPAKEILGRITGIHDYYLARGTMKGSFEKIMREDLSGFASQIKVPTLLVWGKKDRTLPLKDGFLIERLIPASKLKVIEEADHNPHRKTPETLCQFILDFLEEATTNRQMIK